MVCDGGGPADAVCVWSCGVAQSLARLSLFLVRVCVCATLSIKRLLAALPLEEDDLQRRRARAVQTAFACFAHLAGDAACKAAAEADFRAAAGGYGRGCLVRQQACSKQGDGAR